MRLAAGGPKAFVKVAGEPLLAHAVRGARASGVVDVVVVVVPPGWEDAAATAAPGAAVVVGGAERPASVAAGLAVLPADVDVVLVHDAARCCTPPALFVAVDAAVRAGRDAAVPGLPVADTVKRVDAHAAAGGGEPVLETVPRAALRAVQTPQGFRRSVLDAVHRRRADDAATDDALLVERAGGDVVVVPGSAEAFKVTGPLDLELASLVLAGRAARA